MTRRKLPHEKLKPGPKPRASADAVQEQAPEQAQVVTVTTPAPVAALIQAVVPRMDDPLQRNRSPDLMDEAELRQYGTQIGLSRRDVSDLSVERLRVACKHRVYELIEEI